MATTTPAIASRDIAYLRHGDRELNLRLFEPPGDGPFPAIVILHPGGWAHEDRTAVLKHPAWKEAHSLPVVDGSGTYLGAIRYRTWRLLEEEASRARARRDATTADALGDLLATGVAGVVGGLTDLASRATRAETDGGR